MISEDQNENDTQSIQITIDQAKNQVELGEALERLHQNPDFRKVVLHQYIDRETVRLGHLLSDPSMQDAAQQQMVLSDLKAIGCFVNYLRTIHATARMASEAIKVNEDELRQMAQQQKENSAELAHEA